MTTERARDRRAVLASQAALNGIDFVEIVNDEETLLRVHFLNAAPGAAVLAAAVSGATITGGATIPTVAVRPLSAASWREIAGRPALDLEVDAAGDFSTYTLRLTTTARVLDPYFDHARFSFKARCPSTIDCEVAAPECPPGPDDAPPIDYLAKDFLSFRRALSEFSALRYPAWQERSEADFGVMFMEALCSVADDLSYQQDRIAAEAWLETATQRRSIVRLARLVDYEPRVATAARTWLAVEVVATWSGQLAAGMVVSALAPDGTLVDFETGTGLDGASSYFAAPAWNRLSPYWWDDAERCLPPGATAMWIEDPGLALAPGRCLLIDTRPALDGDRPVRAIVQLVEVGTPTTDPLFASPVVRVVWRAEDALEAGHDLARTTLAGNVIPATQGRRFTDRFVAVPGTSSGTSSSVPRATVRTGANGTVQYLHALHHAPLAWLAQDDPAERPRPELRVTEVTSGGRWWRWRRSLLDGAPPRQVVTVDPGEDGEVIRFGDGVFGAIPADGAEFEVTYRAGGGTRGNVAAGAIVRVDPAEPLAPVIVSITNPLPATGGQDAEPSDRVRDMAPQAFRATQFRAVRAEDYEQTAMTLPWVQRAGTTFRYTGSWLSVFTTVDPRAAESVPIERAIELTALLDRRRLAGYESFTLAPRYASLDLEVTVCVRPDAFRGDVKRDVLVALDPRAHASGTLGFFHPDRFSFGVALERSALEAAIQDVAGVDGVLGVSYRRRGHTAGFVAMPDAVAVARDEIIRVDNDPLRPDAGSLQLNLVGGK